MRERAEAATPGPWRYNPDKHFREQGTCRFSEAVFTGPAGKTATAVALTGETDDPQGMADAAHIAAWHPLVAAAVADWLEAAAERGEESGLHFHSLSPGPLAVARAYLGEGE